MRVTPVFILWVVLSGLAQGGIWYREHFLVNIELSWSDAQDYCRHHYHDLSTITNAEENAILNNIKEARTWIGLHRSTSEEDWDWSDGNESSYRNWLSGEPSSNAKRCTLMKRSNGKWLDNQCNTKKPFFCYKWQRKVVLVPEKVSWEEALLHCRKEHADLASLLTDYSAAEADTMANETHTALVWTSLRFLAGEWLWVSESNQVNQEFTQGSLSSCPVQNHRCGARKPSNGQWENKDCQEKLNFFCFRTE